MSEEDDSVGFLDAIFQHLRNIAVCGAIYTVGIALYRHPEWSGLNCPQAFLCKFVQYLAGFEIFLAAGLAILNGFHIWNHAITELHYGIKSRDTETRWTSLYSGVGTIVLYAGVVLSIVLVGAHLQLGDVSCK